MAGLDPAIHALFAEGDHKDVDARHKAGHDEKRPRQNRGLDQVSPVIASAAKQSIVAAKLDCFVASLLAMTSVKSARIEFDDQMRLHLHREGHIGETGDAGVLRGQLGVIDLEVVGHVALGKLDGFQNDGELF
jgi:hypothetical protein